jgi:hypothetical protein
MAQTTRLKIWRAVQMLLAVVVVVLFVFVAVFPPLAPSYIGTLVSARRRTDERGRRRTRRRATSEAAA